MATTCGASAADIQEAEEYCARMDAVFIDSFNEDLMSCMTSLTCEELYDMLADPDAGIDTADTDFALDTASTSQAELCMLNALLNVQPEQPNLNFQENYCKWMMQCDSSLTRAQCDALFRLSELAAYLVLEEPYITDANKCVNPMPRCDLDEVTLCLQSVAETLGSALRF